MKIALVAGLFLLAAVLMVPAGSFLYESGGPQACANCHEMGRQVDRWYASAHRNIPCGKCHGDALTLDAQFHMTNARRVADHWRGKIGEQPRLKPQHVFSMVESCRQCHQQEFAAWSSGPHSSSYERIFLDEKHNRTRHLMDDCLRCHGAHFDGAVRDIVTPVDNQGPWRLVREELRGKPVVPCLSCHAVHRPGSVLEERKLESRTLGNRQEKHRPGLAFYDRRAMESVSVSLLPIPKVQDGGRLLKMSNDPRQALCYQCHAPLASRQVASGDDRTPKGVHEGLSCLACHDKHRQTTRASCSNCHPRLSNCGRDVETMDTTFANPKSTYNIHWVTCADCHPKGVPARKAVPSWKTASAGAVAPPVQAE